MQMSQLVDLMTSEKIELTNKITVLKVSSYLSYQITNMYV